KSAAAATAHVEDSGDESSPTEDDFRGDDASLTEQRSEAARLLKRLSSAKKRATSSKEIKSTKVNVSSSPLLSSPVTTITTPVINNAAAGQTMTAPAAAKSLAS